MLDTTARRRGWLSGAVVLALSITLTTVGAQGADPPALPPGFADDVVIDGLDLPTAFRFAPDGRVVVAEKSGVIKVFDGLDDPTPTVSTGLHVNVHNQHDRGLLGMALDPDFPAEPYLYVFYPYDHEPGTPPGQVPRWGNGTDLSDECPVPAGKVEPECAVDGRLSRLTVSPDGSVGQEVPILQQGWCFHYNSHASGTVEFGPDGFLYVSAGEGAAYNSIIDDGSTSNPCGDPPGEGGALRSQDLRTSGDPTSLDGTVIRIDPVTGEGAPGNPLATSTDPNARRVVAYGFRNPFRFAVREAPGGGTEVFVLDVGWFDDEEINRFRVGEPVANFGWPCYEGTTRNQYWDTVDNPVCETLYAAGPSAVQQPLFSYAHTAPVTAGESCAVGSGSVSAIAFVPPTSWPTELHGALLFGDYSRNCLWALPSGAGGQPDPAAVRPFAQGASTPVMLQAGPGGDLFYLEIIDPESYSGALHRLRYFEGNQPPRAEISADRTSGPTPLTVQLDATASVDPDGGGPLAYAWDLDGDGDFDDSTQAQTSKTYAASVNVEVGLQVTDADGASGTTEVVISPGNTPPSASITSPGPSGVMPGDTVTFAGGATDAEQGALAGGSLRWSLSTLHCPTLDCHDHPSGEWTGSSGSFVVQDHERPAHLLLTLRATDDRGLTSTSSVRLDYAEPPTPTPTPTPAPTPTPTPTTAPPPPPTAVPTAPPTVLPATDTVRLVFRSRTRGVRFRVDGRKARSRLVGRFEVGSRIAVSASRRPVVRGGRLVFRSWRGKGLTASQRRRTRFVLVVPAESRTYVVRYRRR